MKRYTAQEMRDMAEQILHTDDDWYEDAGHMLLQAADMMERESTREKSSQVGNAAAMREALDATTRIDTRMLKRLLCELVEADIFDGGQIRNTIRAVEKARQALSAPPRNCDVGNEKEQSDRLDAFCSKHFRYGDANPCSQCQVAAGSDSSLPCVIMDYSNVRAVCFDCARKAGFMQKKKAVIAFEEECDICKARRPCTDLHHDWIPPEKEGEVKECEE